MQPILAPGAVGYPVRAPTGLSASTSEWCAKRSSPRYTRKGVGLALGVQDYLGPIRPGLYQAMLE